MGKRVCPSFLVTMLPRALQKGFADLNRLYNSKPHVWRGTPSTLGEGTNAPGPERAHSRLPQVPARKGTSSASRRVGMKAFPMLGSPLSLGPIRIRNRVVQLPHGLYFAERAAQLPTERHVDYYARRAAGGVGLIIMESSVVSDDGRGQHPLTLSSDSAARDGYRAIADAVHREGGRMGCQLTHFGNQAASALTLQPLIGASSLGDPMLREQARAMRAADLERVRQDFVLAANNFIEAGFDAVEVKLADDGLLRQFMSPLTNVRGDSYGGSAENRLRFPLEVLAAVRDRIGDGSALGVRLVLDEHYEGGYGLEEGLAFASLLGASGLVDYISSDVGISAAIHWVIPPMGVAEGYAEDAFARAARTSGVPLIACGQISTPEYAERILREGKAAGIGMARQLLTDPDWALKALSGHPERIRPCSRCNQLCMRNSSTFAVTSCTLNPLAGNGERFEPARKDRIGRVTVVGGGPAGMEAARVLGERGHCVNLIEASDHLGGRIELAARCGGRNGWSPYLRWLEGELFFSESRLNCNGRPTCASY